MPSDAKPKRRMVVEEVGKLSESQIKPELEEAPSPDNKPVEEIKEKVEELQGITEHMAGDVEKSAGVQEEIAEAADKVETNPQVENPKFDSPSLKRNGGPNPLLILIPGVLLLGALLGGLYFYQKGVNQGTEATPTPETTIPVSDVTSAPSASPSAKLDLTKFPINVQNGSGIPGTAGSAKDILTKAGFKVGTTGNANNFNYTDTIIKTKSDVPADFVAKLTSTLSSSYGVAKAQTLDSTSKDEVVVIIGSSKAQ